MPYGLMFDSLGAKGGRRIELDSLNDLLNVGKLNRKTIALDGDSLISSVRNQKNGKILREEFIQHKKNYPDSIFRYYSDGFRNVNFSISPELDLRSNSKLVKVKLIFTPKTERGMQKNREEFSLELKKGYYKDLDLVLKQFDIFNDEINR